MDNDSIRAAYKKFRKGDSLTDSELRALRNHFKILLDHLAPFKDMHIVYKAVIMDFNVLDSYAQARKTDRHLRSV